MCLPFTRRGLTCLRGEVIRLAERWGLLGIYDRAVSVMCLYYVKAVGLLSGVLFRYGTFYPVPRLLLSAEPCQPFGAEYPAEYLRPRCMRFVSVADEGY